MSIESRVAPAVVVDRDEARATGALAASLRAAGPCPTPREATRRGQSQRHGRHR